MRGLEALENIRSHNYHETSKRECLKIVEQELKTLEILKPLVSVVDYRGTYYLVINDQGIQIDREKYELLKEVLL